MYETGLLLVCACRTSAASVEHFLGIHAPSLSLGGFRFQAARRGSILFVVASTLPLVFIITCTVTG